jgi:hypothetical protein
LRNGGWIGARLWIAYAHGAMVLIGDCGGPLGCDAGCGGLEIRRYSGEGGEVVALLEDVSEGRPSVWFVGEDHVYQGCLNEIHEITTIRNQEVKNKAMKQ